MLYYKKYSDIIEVNDANDINFNKLNKNLEEEINTEIDLFNKEIIKKKIIVI